MAAATRALLVAAVTAAALFGTALGATYTVGAPAGSWDLRTNYTRWTSTIRFYTGDELRFQYPAAAHNVVESAPNSQNKRKIKGFKVVGVIKTIGPWDTTKIKKPAAE
ncbi:hypothetical protein TRIUR3_26678 [Triticum urartu]|uniref:Uncharacterized protein n=1 Tax=Triticum urartu TaxID=4572 RepID=M8ADB2_TRIUA|nr:hypothetical protein TRIUR3_26678 [Triticum urartu]